MPTNKEVEKYIAHARQPLLVEGGQGEWWFTVFLLDDH